MCLGLEVVLAGGRVLDLMGELRKDNAGYALRQIFIGAEGTLGIITAAVLRLSARPLARATAMLALPSLPAALALLSRAEDEVGGVEAFEWMPRSFIEGHLRLRPEAREPFEGRHEVNVLLEVATTAARDALPGPDGATPLEARLEALLGAALEEGALLDAVVARSEAQRREMWARREDAAPIALLKRPFVDTDIALPLDAVEPALRLIRERVAALDPGATDLIVAHLGDGNLHYTAYPSRDDTGLHDAIRAAVDGTAREMGGSFSAEHGVGLSKLPAMRALKDPVALDVMRDLKRALDPQNLMNPGKVLP
jgi:FAD/FMN-containing dehydrogenase